MKYSLKKEYKELLKEELVSIIKDDSFSEEIFDVVFDEDGNISSGSKFSPTDAREDRTYKKIFDQSLAAQDFTNESRLKIIKFLEKCSFLGNSFSYFISKILRKNNEALAGWKL